MAWLEVAVVTDGEAAEAVAEALRPYAIDQSVVLEQLGDQEDLHPEAMEPHVTVKIYLPADEDIPALRRKIEETIYYLGRLYPMPAPTFRTLQEEDWANAWKVHYAPFRIGKRLWIQPSWQEAEETNSDDLILTLDPGMAFGTGLHPTTQLCLQVLEEMVQPQQRILDVGTGSGILAIAAAKLGAGFVYGVDTDEVAVASAQQNVAHNHVSHQIEIAQGTLTAVSEKEWDIVVVNILAPVIIHLFEQDGLLSYVKNAGMLILSGILDQQQAEVEAVIAGNGGQVVQQLAIRDWIALVVKPN